MPQLYWIDWEAFEDSSYFNGVLQAGIPVSIMPGEPRSFHDENSVQCVIIQQKTRSGLLRGIVMPWVFLCPVKEELLNEG